jgi:8-oxo-dGTP pyrophosphatase MutT (NUDIX family)
MLFAINDRQAQMFTMLKSGHVSTGALDSPSKSNTIIHQKARIERYPNSTTKRFKVPDDKVPWEAPFPEYVPVIYEAPVVEAGPYWADVSLVNKAPSERELLEYNKIDSTCNVNRVSHTGKYNVVDNLPLNPMGRTGITGRGLLGRFGPNHAADPIATRWKHESGGIMKSHGKRVLEFIAIQRKDNSQWAIPGGMVEPGDNVSMTLKKEFSEEALANLNMEEDQKRIVADRIAELFRNGREIYKGYVDDPRNTDNAWMETVACNFHDDTGEVFGEFKLQAGDDAQAVRWQRVSGNIPLFASHVSILEKVALLHDADF